jgi:hypothetical protein
VFSVLEGTNAFTASEYQYTEELYVWTGSYRQSGSALYEARKFPNQSGAGIFDFSRMINSTFQELSATDGSYIKNYKTIFGWQYESGSTYVTQSATLQVSCSTGGTFFKAYDGYNVYPNSINSSLFASDLYWPLMSDAASVTQSVLITDKSSIGTYLKGLSIWVGTSDNTLPTSVECTASYANGSKLSSTTAITTGFASTTQSVLHLPSAPGDATWSTYWPTTTNLDTYVFKIKNGNTVMEVSSYQVDCAFYYEPIRIAWKNRYGQFDFLNFYKRHDNTFNTDQRVFQQQVGTWQSSTLSYNQYQTKTQRYIVDATEVLECNTDWLQEGYNELFKQMLVSDEMYWCYDQTNNLIKPLTIKTNSLMFKTGVNNKLIQYTIAFDIGQPYKLIL